MSSKRTLIWLSVISVCCVLGYFYVAYQKQRLAEVAVHTWQENAAEYLSFDYQTVRGRVWDNALTLQQVQVAYPVLMSIGLLQIKPVFKNNLLVKLRITAKDIDFTWPRLTSDQSWRGNLSVDYAYNPEQEQISLSIAPDFPHLLTAAVEAVLVKVAPGIDIVFNYTDALLAELQVEVQSVAFLPKQAVPIWVSQLQSQQQQDAVVNLLQQRQPLHLDFLPEYPVPVYRFFENPLLFWHHPAVNISG